MLMFVLMFVCCTHLLLDDGRGCLDRGTLGIGICTGCGLLLALGLLAAMGITITG